MTEKFSYDAMAAVLMAPEIKEIKEKVKNLQIYVDKVYRLDNDCLENFNTSFKYLINSSTKDDDILISKQKADRPFNIRPKFFTDKFLKENNIDIALPCVDAYATLSIRNDSIGILIADSDYSCYSPDPMFLHFTNYESFKNDAAMRNRCLTNALFNPSYSKQLSSILNNDGISVFNDISNKYYDSNLVPLDTIKFSYKINNITQKEKELFKIRTDDAFLYFKVTRNAIMLFLSNGYEAKGTPYPEFNYREFFDDPEKLNNVNEKLFILNHSDDILNAINSFEDSALPKIISHIKFMEDTNEILKKYVLAAKL